jgi:long-chain fatty acid transport protein
LLRNLVCAAVLCLACEAQAGGLFIQEFGTPTQATAGAGATAKADDASTAFHNPAGMTRLDDHALMLAAGVLVGDIEFDASATTPFPGGDGGQQGGPGPVLGAHYVHRLLDRPDAEYFDRVRLGLSLVSISAAVLDPKNDWSGRFEVQKLGLVTLSGIPSIGVRICEEFSIGAGANLMYGLMNYKVAVPLPGPGEGQVEFDKIDDFAAGATVSALWEPTDRTRVGVIWSQELDLDLSGDVKLKGLGASANIITKIPFAQAVRTSLLHEITPTLWIAGNFRWEDWSSFNKQWVTVAGFKTQIDRGWGDTFGGSLGGRWQFADRWALLGGVGYDSSPVSASDRTADMPVDRQVRVGIGTQYAWGENRTVGLNFSYANLGPAKIRSETLSGSYDSNQLFSVTLYLGFAKLPWSRAN